VLALLLAVAATTANAQAPAARPVLFLGASVIRFWKAQDPEFFAAHPGYVVRGVPGQTSAEVLHRAPRELADVQPAVVVILAGGNNDVAAGVLGATTRDNLAAIVRLVRSRGATPVLCALTSAQPDTDALLADYARKDGVLFVDFASMRAPDGGFRKGLTFDGLHPTPDGYHLMDPLVLAAIGRAMASP
jgi:lysophospholipase L1-like esterase